MNIKDAIARLDRAGSENSRATQKLFEAARTVAELIKDRVPTGVALPDRYKVIEVKSNVGYASYLVRTPGRFEQDGFHEYIDSGSAHYLHGDFNAWIPGATRDSVLIFARDVSEGLLDKISAFLEERTAEEDQATQALLAAAEVSE